MMVTMHSILRDSYARRATAFDSLVLLSSLVIAALAFFDPVLLDWLPWTIGSTRIAIGILAIISFFSGVVAWRVDWKGRAEAHNRAASDYTNVKFSLGAMALDMEDHELESLLIQCEGISKNSVAVPDSRFLALKSEHLLKTLLSRVLDRYPAASVRLVRLRIRLHQTIAALNWKRNVGQGVDVCDGQH